MAVETLSIRKLADTSAGDRVVRFDPETGQKILVNPVTNAPEPWPLIGIKIEGDVPTRCRVPTSFVMRGRGEGWLEVEGDRAVIRPGGPPDAPWTVDPDRLIPHTFMHVDAIVLKCIGGDVRYTVTHQPDKYVADGDDIDPVTDELYAAGATRVDWFYDLELAP